MATLNRTVEQNEIGPFSVLMAVYSEDNPDNFEAALRSTIEQSLPPDQIVLVVDGPLTPALDEIITRFEKNCANLFTIVRLPKHQGLGDALRAGVLACQHELIARMDADDISTRERFEKQIKFLQEHVSIAVVGSHVEEFNLRPGDLKIFKRMPEKGRELMDYAKHRNPLNHPSIVFRKSAVIHAGNYCGEIRFFEDYMLFIKMLLLGYQFYNIQEVLLHFRVGDRMENIKRRSGPQYLKKEIKFLLYARALKYLSTPEFIWAILTKPLIRLLPKPIILWSYKTFLRRRS